MTSFEKAPDRSEKERSAPTVRGVASPEPPTSAPLWHLGNQGVQRLIQAKLTVGPADDPDEQEADSIARAVVAMAEPSATRGGLAQRAPIAAGITPVVQPSGSSRSAGFDPGPTFESGLERSTGSPLPASTRAFMEPRFGADFSGVRLHSGSDSARLNRAIDAQAFTRGQNIYLGGNRSDIDSGAGRQLLAHELAHTIQQGGASAAVARLVSSTRIQRDGGAAEEAPLIDRYRAALTAAAWERAAVLLNGFSDVDIKARVDDTAELPPSSRTAMRLRTPEWNHRVRRALLLRDYDEAKAAGRWADATTTLNGFSDDDIRKLASQLSPPEVNPLISGALEAMTGVSQSRVLNGIYRRYDEVSPDPPGTKALTVVALMKQAGFPIELAKTYLALRLGIAADQVPAPAGQGPGDDQADVKNIAAAMGAAAVVPRAPKQPQPKRLQPEHLEKGNLAHALIGDVYCTLNPPSVSDWSVIDILSLARKYVRLTKAIKEAQADVFTNLDMRPDIVDLGKFQIFEIKPIGSAALASPEALLYVGLFNALGLGGISFTLGNPANRGTSGMIPGPQETVVWASPWPGAIIYTFVNTATDNPKNVQERIGNGDLVGKRFGLGVEAVVALGAGATVALVEGIVLVSPAVLASFETLIAALTRAVRLAGQPILREAAH